jgi:peptidoglycan/LPS O-acetylase OafA/YrhL
MVNHMWALFTEVLFYALAPLRPYVLSCLQAVAGERTRAQAAVVTVTRERTRCSFPRRL